MKLNITYELPNYRKMQFQLLANQSITVGRSDEAEHPVYTALEMEDVHFRIVTSDDACWLFNLASDYTTTALNGVPVRETLLHDGDHIRAGEIVFQVTLSGGLAKSSPAPASAAIPANKQSQSYRYRPGRCGLHHYQDNGDDFHTEHVLQAINRQRLFQYLLVNFRAAGVLLPPYLAAEQDLFRHAPAEIRLEHSLHLIANGDLARLHQLFQEFSLRDAAICVVTDRPPRDFLSQHHLYLAWFARPSLLKFHLEEASEAFVEKLMSNLHGVFFKGPQEKSWALTVNSSLVPDWKHLGFEVPPTSSELA